MKKTALYVLLGTALIVGLAIGCGGGTRFGTIRAGRVQNASLRVGDVAPDFRLPGHTGSYVRLSDFRGEKNVVVAFYPLAWTPV